MSITASVTVTLSDADATRSYGRALAEVLRAGDLVVLTGDLGAGKTTLTQGIGAGLQVRGQVASASGSVTVTLAVMLTTPPRCRRAREAPGHRSA